MSSRREEKEARRAERLAQEEAHARSEARRRRLGIVLGVLLAVAAVAAIVIALASGGGGGDEPEPTGDVEKTPVPAQRTTDLNAAARAAGCEVRSFEVGPNDRQHVSEDVEYRTNPPSYGPHAPAPASDGDYVGQGTPAKEALVHSLEHGRVILHYKPGLDARRVGQLQTLLGEKPKPNVIPGYNALLVQNDTGMPYEVAATAWGRFIGCRRFTDASFDALRAFRTAYVDKAPELIQVPQ